MIWGRVAAVRANLTIERLEQIFLEFQDKGLLFVWEHEGKRYAHWTGSDVPGRLPPPSWRMRLEKFAPPVPKQRLAEYMSRFARGRAALAGVGFRGEELPQEFRSTAGARHSDPQHLEGLRSEISDLKFEISNLKSEARTSNVQPEIHGAKERSREPRSGAKEQTQEGAQRWPWKRARWWLLLGLVRKHRLVLRPPMELRSPCRILKERNEVQRQEVQECEGQG